MITWGHPRTPRKGRRTPENKKEKVEREFEKNGLEGLRERQLVCLHRKGLAPRKTHAGGRNGNLASKGGQRKPGNSTPLAKKGAKIFVSGPEDITGEEGKKCSNVSK